MFKTFEETFPDTTQEDDVKIIHIPPAANNRDQMNIPLLKERQDVEAPT